MKALRLLALGLVAGLYTTVAIQALWNWFVSPALSVPEIGYWNAYGLSMVGQVMMTRTTFQEDKRWERLSILVHACIPDEARAGVQEQIEADEQNAWFEGGAIVVGQCVGTTITLAIGWLIHAVAS